MTASYESEDRAALKGASVNGLVITFTAQFVRLGMQFVYQVVIARLLTPREFGLVAMASPIQRGFPGIHCANTHARGSETNDVVA